MDMPVRQGPCLFSLAGHDRPIELAVLLHEHGAGFGTLGIHAADVGHHIAFEQIEQTANGVQQYGVVTGFGDGQVKACIGSALLCPVGFALSGVAMLQRLEGLRQALAIRFGGAQGRVIGA